MLNSDTGQTMGQVSFSDSGMRRQACLFLGELADERLLPEFRVV